MNKNNKSRSWFTRLKRFLQVEPQNKEDLITLLREAQNRSIIDLDTLAMIEGIILLSQLRVRDVMLPKKQMVSVSEDAKFNEILYIVSKSGHSRFPVTDNKGDVIGVLHAKDLLRFQPEKQCDVNALDLKFNLYDIIRQATFIPESKRLDLLLREFRLTRNHMAVVVDEYGEIGGFITLEDIIEQIIGDIEDEFDIDEESYIKIHSNKHYIIKAHTPIEEFNEQLRANFSDQNYDTIGGIVMTNFGYLPKRGESIQIDQFEFKVLNADARRIKLLECIDLRSPIRTNIE